MAGTTVCSMCGDVGFPDKLFRCARCRRRFQHSYCTNYYGDAAPAEAGAGVCDWCLSDDAGKKRPYISSASSAECSNSKQQQAAAAAAAQGRSEQQQAFPPISGWGNKGAGKVTGGEHEGGRRARRYKLLKDVMC
ncbi:unnamed protein product [Urochloa decumbens]|uniref:PHD-type zinc finger plants domain-containing protein n=1 Tax=Urochloa decumbens TaxID=240449 RepID=A0ABC8ZUV1_9POAL